MAKKTVTDGYVRYITPSEADILFEESGYTILPQVSKDLVLVAGNQIKCALCWKASRSSIYIYYLKVFDSDHKCNNIFKELVSRVPETATLLICLLDEYAVAEQICLRDSGFDLDNINGSKYKFTKEI